MDETDLPNGECMTYKLFYYLEDDTVAIKELKENREGRDHFPMLLRKTKLPKNWKRQPITFPSVYLEVSDEEVTEFYQPKDFHIGGTIYVFGRRFLLLDCDKFTRQYYEEVLKDPQSSKMAIKQPDKHQARRPLPEYIGLGTPEDSLASCYGLTPKPPKKDVITYLLNANKYLRYGACLDNAHPEDKIRKFIINFSLADGRITITEPQIRNSGITGGRFLAAQKVWRPNCDPNNPDYYTPKDLYIGAILIINCHRFRIESADLYVYYYMREHPEFFTPEAIASVRNYHLAECNLKDELKAALLADCDEYRMRESQKMEKGEQEDNSYEECLRRVNVVKQDPHALNDDCSIKEPDPLRNPTYSGDPNRDCPFVIKVPTLEEQQITAPVDPCHEKFISEACSIETPLNPHKNVRFK